VDVVTARLRVVIDRDLCEGNARCVAVAPAVFHIPDDKDQVELVIAEPGPELRAVVERAIELCPRQALALVSD
jgi:ferredoxin